jgi:hypothetical protein
MGAWLYQWENGDVSMVIANSRDQAAFILDEFGPAEPDRLKPINNVAIDFPISGDGKDFTTGQLSDDLIGKLLGLMEDYAKSGKREQFEKEMAEHEPTVCPEAPPNIL